MASSGAPPRPPDIPRTIRLTSAQLVLLPLLLAVVLLALAGVFGESTTEMHASSGPLDLRLACPSRLRYRQTLSLVVEVRNAGPGRLEAVQVALDPAYLAHFAAVRVSPSETSASRVLIGPMEAGGLQRVSLELAGDDYGRHRGTFEVTAGAAAARLTCSTFVFP